MKHLRRTLRRAARRLAAADFLGPDERAGFLIDPQKQQLVFGCVRGDEDRIAPDCGRAGAPLGQRTFPDNAAILVPDDRQLFLRADPRSFRPAPLRPVSGGRLSFKDADQWEQDAERHAARHSQPRGIHDRDNAKISKAGCSHPDEAQPARISSPSARARPIFVGPGRSAARCQNATGGRA